MEEIQSLAKSKKLNSILFAVVIIVVIVFVNRMAMHSAEISSWESVNAANQREVEIWKNEAGHYQASALSANASIDVLKAAIGSELNGLRDEVKGLKKNMSNLQSLTQLNLATSGTITTGTRDTLILNGTKYDTALAFSQKDKWADISGYALKGKSVINYKFYDSLNFVAYWERPKLFANRELKIDIISYNPNSSITGLKSYNVKPAPLSRFGAGPYVGVDFTGRFTVGVGVFYSLIRL